MNKICINALALLAGALVSVGAMAQDFPVRPLRLVTLFAPGSTSDIHARYVAQKMAEPLGQTVFVDNKPGAGGLIAIRDVLKSQPLGYSMLYSSPDLVGNLHAYRNPQYRLEDFAVVGPLGLSSWVMLINTVVPAKTLPEFVAYAKANPGKLNYGSLGPGAGSTINAERFKEAAGIDMVMIPFKGGDPLSAAMLAGDVHVYFVSMGTARARMRIPKIIGLALTSEQRYKALPDIPTFKELGYPSMLMGQWSAVFVPAGAPAPAIAALQGAMKKVIGLPETRALLEKQDVEIFPGSAEQFAAFIRREGQALAADYKRLNIPVQD